MFSQQNIQSSVIKSPVVHTNAVLAKLVAQEPFTSATTPITTPSFMEFEELESNLRVDLIKQPKFAFISLNRLANNCATEKDDLPKLKEEIKACHKVIANNCEGFHVVLQCLVDFQQRRCHLFDMASFESDLHAHLIENYEHTSFASECKAFANIHGNIFHTSTRLCSQNHIDEEKLKKKECSTVEEHNLVLQVKFKHR